MSLFDVYSLFDVEPEQAKDVYVYDKDNTTYLDLYGGHAVISIGHSHPQYVENLATQLSKIAFYSNSVKNSLQVALAEHLTRISGCLEYQLFMCNSGAEANENALKLASFHTKKSKIIAFKNAFHGRTSATVSATDNPNIISPLNAKHGVIRVDFNDVDGFKNAIAQEDICAVILETIQGVGGLDEVKISFFKTISDLCKQTNTVLIADEIQSGFGRTGDFFAFQAHGITPDIITMAKGMGNGFPVGGILIHPDIKASKGLLGTTFGGNHLACIATLSVLQVLEKERLMLKVKKVSTYFMEQAQHLPGIKKIKGRGLMLGLEFDFPISMLRSKLLYTHKIFTGSSKNLNILRILPPLTIQKKHIDLFIDALHKELK